MEIWRWLTFLVPRVRTWPFLPVFSEPITQAERGKEDKAFCLAWQCTINTSMGDHGVCVCVCSCSCVWWIHQFKAGKPSQKSLQRRHFQHLSRTFRKYDTRSRQWYTRKSATRRRHVRKCSGGICESDRHAFVWVNPSGRRRHCSWCLQVRNKYVLTWKRY